MSGVLTQRRVIQTILHFPPLRKRRGKQKCLRAQTWTHTLTHIYTATVFTTRPFLITIEKLLARGCWGLDSAYTWTIMIPTAQFSHWNQDPISTFPQASSAPPSSCPPPSSILPPSVLPPHFLPPASLPPSIPVSPLPPSLQPPSLSLSLPPASFHPPSFLPPSISNSVFSNSNKGPHQAVSFYDSMTSQGKLGGYTSPPCPGPPYPGNPEFS